MNVKKPCRKLLLPAVSFLLFPLFSSLAYAQQETNQTAPTSQTVVVTGGDSFEDAEELAGPDSYELGATVPADTKRYFKISGYRPGEQIKVLGDFEGDPIVNLVIYSSEKEELARYFEIASSTETFEVSWLSGKEASSGSYYIVLEVSPDGDLTSAAFEVEKNSFYDGGAEGDAGNSYQTAMDLEDGIYTSYLAGENGDDEEDFYKIDLREGFALILKVTPPTEVALDGVTIYNSSREELKRQDWPNPGALVTLPFLAEKSGTYFIKIKKTYPSVDAPIEYELNADVMPFSTAEKYFEEDELPSDSESTGGIQKETGVDIPTAQEEMEKEAQGLVAKFTQGINMVLVVGVGIVALIVGFISGFFTAKLLSGGKKKDTISQETSEDTQD